MLEVILLFMYPGKFECLSPGVESLKRLLITDLKRSTLRHSACPSDFYSISNFDAQDVYAATMAALSSSSLPSPNQTDLDPIACSISIPLPPTA